MSEGNTAKRRRVRPPSDRALEREQEIYEVAADIFHRKGYAATTLQDIAEAVGLLKGSLYYYIDTKEDLLYRISRTIHEGAQSNLAAARSASEAPAERLRTLVEGHVMAFGHRLSWIRVFYTEHNSLSPERRREIMAARRSYERFVDEVIAAGQADGSFCPDLDRRIAASALLTTLNTVYQWYRPGSDAPIDVVAKTYAELLLNGLRCPVEHMHAPGRRPSRSVGRPTG